MTTQNRRPTIATTTLSHVPIPTTIPIQTSTSSHRYPPHSIGGTYGDEDHAAKGTQLSGWRAILSHLSPGPRPQSQHDRDRDRNEHRSKPKSTSRHLQPHAPLKRKSRWQSALYQLSFTFILLITAAVLLGSLWGLGEQAWRTGGQRRWNIVILTGAYAAIAIISLLHFFSRVRTNRRQIRTMPKPYMPTKALDLDQKVADHISTEYSRTAVIAHIGQATTGMQEGWGAPGTIWADKHFRTFITGTLNDIRPTLGPLYDSLSIPPHHSGPISHSLVPIRALAQHSAHPASTATPGISASTHVRAQPDPLFALLLNTYCSYIEKSLYARREPREEDAEAVEELVIVIQSTAEVKKRRIAEAESQEEADKGGQRTPDRVADRNYAHARTYEQEVKSNDRSFRRARTESISKTAAGTGSASPSKMSPGGLDQMRKEEGGQVNRARSATVTSLLGQGRKEARSRASSQSFGVAAGSMTRARAGSVFLGAPIGAGGSGSGDGSGIGDTIGVKEGGRIRAGSSASALGKNPFIGGSPASR